MLSKAIAIRDKNGTPGFHFYEWNRAVCAIHLDPAFSRNEVSTTEQRTVIEGDLRAAARHLGDAMFIAGPQADQNTQTVTSWLALNALSLAQLKTT